MGGESEGTAINYQSPIAPQGKYYLAEHFDNKDTFSKNWIKSEVS